MIDRHRNEDAAVVRNTDILAIVAEFLGVTAQALEIALSYKTKLLKKELCTVFLDPDGATDNRRSCQNPLFTTLRLVERAYQSTVMSRRLRHLHWFIRSPWTTEHDQPCQFPRPILHQLRQRTTPEFHSEKPFREPRSRVHG